MDSRDVFIHNLNTTMKDRKVSRKELAKGLNVPYTTLTDWCTGRIFPRVEKINMIADYFGIKKSDLLEEMIETEDDSLDDDTVIVEFGNNKNCRIPMHKNAIAEVERDDDSAAEDK